MGTVNRLACSDGSTMVYHAWIPANNHFHAVVQILHGMAEHGARYERFATYLNGLGIAVYAQDHRGHGMTAADDDLGWFAPNHGWDRVVQDSRELSAHIVQIHQGKDLFLFGHSMGSFLARSIIAQDSSLYRGAVISGTSCSQGALGVVGRLLAAARATVNGGKKPDALLDKMSFGAFSKAFEPRRTDFDWLSRDEAEVDAYIQDPACGFVCSSRFFVDLLDGIAQANNPALIAGIPKDFPLLFISGSLDPVGAQGKGVSKAFNLYAHAGMTECSLKMFEGARHELLNETNRDEVHVYIGSWIEAHISRRNR